MPDHVHMCVAIPPKHSVASIIGFLKGRVPSVARMCGREQNFTGASIFGLRVMPSPRSGSNWTKSAHATTGTSV